MSGQKNSAEIVEIGDARARLRPSEIDPKNFPAVGQYLEAVREQSGLSLAAVSERTHIKASYLEAIEKMAIDRLPNRAFAVGFAKVYAEALGLKAEPVIERFKAESGLGSARKEADPAAHGASHATAKPAAAPREPARLSFFAVLAVLAFMVWCAYWITQPRDPATPLRLDGVPLSATVEHEATAITDPIIAPATATPPAGDDGAVAPAPREVEAQIIERVEPVYPPACEAGAAAVETIEVAFTITPDGAVVSERIASATNACFERAALNAVKRWRFSPYMKDGVARPVFEQRASLRFDRPS